MPPRRNVLFGAALTVGAGTLATLKAGRWLGLGLGVLSVGGVGLAAMAGALVAEVLIRRRGHLPDGSYDSNGRRIHNDEADNTLQCELQQLLEVAISRPRLLLTDRWQGKVHRVAHRLGVSNGGGVPWQLLFVYRQLEAVIDSLTYDELYEIFGGNPTPAAITREEARLLPSRKYSDNTKKEKGRSDTAACLICLEDYKKGEKLAVLPGCHHVFHAACVTQWLRSVRGDCPICRTHVKDRLGDEPEKDRAGDNDNDNEHD